MNTEEKESHVVETLKKCLDLVQAMNKLYGERDNHYTVTTGDRLQQEIKSALEIASHNAVQMPRSKEEAGMMIMLARMYLGEIEITSEGVKEL